ncbi:beta-galactosidase [Microbacterium lacus]|uniref:beta-galactosidase n=1 Tax=Microbacterium lacus TaxID=415217 RepID=UPI00384B8475
MTELTLSPRGWDSPPRTAPMPAAGEEVLGLAVTDRAVLRDGAPWIPVSGELHYSRIPRARWGERARQLRAGGISVASTYVFWLHHSPERGVADFEGQNDVAAFIDECAASGLEVCLRIGPWAHGEARNGGFPDWVQEQPVIHRSDDPVYLDLVREWFGQLAAALGGRARPGGPIIAIQLENELYDRPEHLSTLKRLAREAGMSAPLWTATAWGGAELPTDEVFPLYGGYGDGFWTEPDAPWDDSFRAHYFFSHVWDDPGVGADVREAQGFSAASAPENDDDEASVFPPATCELGGGMATAYHRRPRPSALDVAAVAHIKVGNGSMWQGYYMYAGGTNPGPGLHESQATGYPNDMVPLSYDFHAAIGQSGDVTPSYALLRGQHAFLSAFGEILGDLHSSLPDVLPTGLDDAETVRWAVRSDGDRGFLFVNRHQPHLGLADSAPVQFRIGDLVLPSEPVAIPAGSLSRWPLGLSINGERLDWATASVLTVLDETLVLVADEGVPVEISVNGVVRAVEPSWTPVADGLLVLPSALAHDLWVREVSGGGRVLLHSPAPLTWSDRSPVTVRGGNNPEVASYDPASGRWRKHDIADREVPALSSEVGLRLERAGEAAASDYGFGGERHTAPSPGRFDDLAAVYRLELPEWSLEQAHDAVLRIDWAGDVAELRVGGVAVDDRYWDGSTWTISVLDLGLAAADVTLHVLPLSAESTVWVPESARARRTATTDDLLAVDAVRVSSRGPWREVVGT